MAEIDEDVVNEFMTGDINARRQAVGSVDDNPDQAAEAYKLGEATGVAPLAVYGDLDGFKSRAKSSISGEIVKNNQNLISYINSHPLASKVSNDDYANLDNVSTAFQKLYGVGKDFGSNTYDVAHDVIKGLVSGPTQYEDLEKNTREYMLKQGVSEEQANATAKTIGERAYRSEAMQNILFAIPTLLASPVIGAYRTAVSVPLEKSYGIPHDVTEGYTMALLAAFGMKGAKPETIHQEIAKLEPYLAKGEEPPVGVSAGFDTLKADRAKEDLDNFKEVMKAADKSLTKERAPDLFASFAAMHNKSDIGIPFDRIQEIYGDKIPHVGDGLLGDFNIANQFRSAMATGGDIRIPMPDWIAKVDPKLAKELEDDIRLRPNGMTVNEAKEFKPKESRPDFDRDTYEPIEDGSPTLSAVRAQAGLRDYTAALFDASPGHAVPFDKGPQIFTAQNLKQELQTARSMGTASVKEILPKMFLEDATGVLKNYEALIVDLITKHAGDTPVHIVSDKAFAGMKTDPESAGYYDPVTHKIVIPESQWYAEGPRTLLHESIHAATSRALHARPELLDRVSSLMLDIERQWPGIGKEYGWKDEHEFLAEAFTNKKFQEQLGQIQVSDSLAKALGLKDIKPSFWDVFVDFVRSAFNIPKDSVSALEAAIKFTKEAAETKLSQAEKKYFSDVKNDLASKPIQKQGELDVTRQEDKDIFQATALGMNKPMYERYKKLIAEQRAEDNAWQLDQAKKDIEKRQTKEWKEKSKEIKESIRDDIENRPDIAALNLFKSGELHGEKVGKPKFDESKLTPEEKAALPKEFYGKGGFDPDLLANQFGFQTGETLIQRLAGLEKSRGDVPMSKFVERVLDDATQKAMEKAYGKLEDNILNEAKDHVVGNTQMDLIHEEMLAAALQSGAQLPISKQNMAKMAKDYFKEISVEHVDRDKFLAEAGRSARAYEVAILENGGPNWAEAFKQKQRQQLLMLLSKEAGKFEKEKDSFDKTAKRFSKRDVAGLLSEYTNFIHDILLRTGNRVNRSIQDLAQAIQASGFDSLKEFVQEKHNALREMPVAEDLLDPNFRKPMDKMSVEEFRALRDSIKTMIHNGRDEMQVEKAGEKADLKEITDKMLDQIKSLGPPEGPDISKGQKHLPSRIMHIAKTFFWSGISTETMLNRFDRDNWNGLHSQYIMRGLADASNFEAKLIKDYQTKIREATKDLSESDLKKKIENNLWIDPLDGQPLVMSRRNVLGILQNAGNADNLRKLAMGYKLTPEQVMTWLHQHTTKEDWNRAQKIGDIFEELFGHANKVSENVSGLTIEAIERQPIDTPHGQYKGWYNPVKYDSARPGESKKLLGPNALEEEGYFRAIPPRSYTIKRSGYVAPVELNLDVIAPRIQQMIHDIAFREPILQASKFFYDPAWQRAVKAHYGDVQAKQFLPYLKDVANQVNFRSDAEHVAGQVIEGFRQNIIGTLIGFNPHTVAKHSLTAWANSMTEVGSRNFLDAVASLTRTDPVSQKRNWGMAMEKSEELQRRVRNWSDLIQGGAEISLMKSSMREMIIAAGSTPVAMGDLASSVPTWLASYKKALTEGHDEGYAVSVADRSVRRAHGSSVTTNRPAIMRGGPIAQTFASLYGFFSHMMNKQYEISWKAKDAFSDLKDKGSSGDLTDAKRHIPYVLAGIASFVIIPALVEEAVTPIFDNEHESWGVKAAKTIGLGLSSSFVGVRDVIHAAGNMRDPSVGLLSEGFKPMVNVVRDLSKGKRAFNKEEAGRLIRHTFSMVGMLSGLTNAQTGRTAEYVWRYMHGLEHPKGMLFNKSMLPGGPGTVAGGLTSGTAKERKH